MAENKALHRRMVLAGAILTVVILALACGSGLQQQLARADRERMELVRQNQELSYNLRQMTERLNKHEEVESAQGAALNACRTDFQRAESRRLELENSDVGILLQRATRCESDILTEGKKHEQILKDAATQCGLDKDERRARGYAEGQLHVLNSIEIIGAPEREKGILFDDFYYVFQVRVGNRRVVLTRIRTHKEETAFGAALASLRDVAVAFATRK